MLYQAYQNYQNPYFFFEATHQAQHCALASPNQNLHHCDLHHPGLYHPHIYCDLHHANLYHPHIYCHDDYTHHQEYPWCLLPSHLVFAENHTTFKHHIVLAYFM
jgi:hypothetical protein